MLPEMSGIVVLHEIRKISNIPVIMLTALDDEYTQSNSFDEMADDYTMSFPHGLKPKRKIFRSWSMPENGQKQKRRKHLRVTMKSSHLF